MRSNTVRKNDNLTYLPGTKGVNKRRGKNLVVFLVLGLLFYFSALFVSQYIQFARLRHDLRDLKTRIAAVQEQNQGMLREIERLHTSEYVETMARQELGMVRPGEVLFFFQEADMPAD